MSSNLFLKNIRYECILVPFELQVEQFAELLQRKVELPILEVGIYILFTLFRIYLPSSMTSFLVPNFFVYPPNALKSVFGDE